MQCTQNNTYTKMNLCTVKWAQWDKTQSGELLGLFICVCVLRCAQLLHTILHRTDLIIYPLTLHTITIAPMMSVWGKGGMFTWKISIKTLVVVVMMSLLLCRRRQREPSPAAVLKQKMDGLRANRARWKCYSQVTWHWMMFTAAADVFLWTLFYSIIGFSLQLILILV